MKIHPLSDVQSKQIGPGTSVWQFCVILERAVIGADCNIASHCFIEHDVRVGNRVTIKNGVYLFDSIIIEDDVFIGPNATFTNDPYPRSRRGRERGTSTYPLTRVCRGASVGGGATILPGVTIGEKAIVGAGSTVTKDVPPGSIVTGTAATFRRLAQGLN